jgi:hypothetical protein
MKATTPFLEALKQAENKEQPYLKHQDGNVYPELQFYVKIHLQFLLEMSRGYKFHGITLNDYKTYYGLQSKTYRKCYEELQQIYKDYYENR